MQDITLNDHAKRVLEAMRAWQKTLKTHPLDQGRPGDRPTKLQEWVAAVECMAYAVEEDDRAYEAWTKRIRKPNEQEAKRLALSDKIVERIIRDDLKVTPEGLAWARDEAKRLGLLEEGTEVVPLPSDTIMDTAKLLQQIHEDAQAVTGCVTMEVTDGQVYTHPLSVPEEETLPGWSFDGTRFEKTE